MTNLNPMPEEQRDDYEPTEEDIEMVVEEFTVKPVKPANLAAGIASMQRRIAQLETERTKLLNCMAKNASESLKEHIASVNKDLAIARERLVYYKAQLNSQN